MAESIKTSVVIEYSKPGVEPPIYVAGSFSEWQPQQMECIDDSDGRKFTKQVDVEEGKEYQYKFRLGDGNWWELDETAATVTDESGNRNNLLCAPIKSSDDTTEKEDTSSIPIDVEEETTVLENSDSTTVESEEAPPTITPASTDGHSDEAPAAVVHEDDKAANIETADGVDDEESPKDGSAAELIEAPEPTLDEDQSWTDVVKEEPAVDEVSASTKPEESNDEHATNDDTIEGSPVPDETEKGHVESENPEPAAHQEESYADVAKQEPLDEEPTPTAETDDSEDQPLESEQPQPTQPEEQSGIDVVKHESTDEPTDDEPANELAATKDDDVEPEPKHPLEPTEHDVESYADVAKHEPVHEPIDEPVTTEEDDTEKEQFNSEDPTPQEQPELEHHEQTEHVNESYADIVAHEASEETVMAIEKDGDDAPVAQKDAYAQHAEDVEPDHIAIRNDAVTPEPSEVAAEVADSAASLDHEPPTPPMSDSEAGSIGYRRLSHTPIAEVADTAAEVADTSAMMESQSKPTSIKIPSNGGDIMKDLDDMTPSSGLETPFDERVPKFPHECNGPPTPEDIRDHQATPVHTAAIRTPLFQEHDPNDPGLEPFPSNYNGIMQHVRRLETQLGEDHTSMESIPSDHLGDNDDAVLPTPSSPSLPQQNSPLLGSIAEENVEGNEQDDLTPLAEKNSQEAKEIASDDKPIDGEAEDTEKGNAQAAESSMAPPGEPSQVAERSATPNTLKQPPQSLPDTPFVESEGMTAEDLAAKPLSGGQGPDITVQPATPSSSVNTTDPIAKPNGTKSTSFADDSEESQLRARKQKPSRVPERSITPTSLHSVGTNNKSRNFLRAFFQVVFVDWIGGLIKRLCGGGRHTLLAVSATVIVVIGPALYFFA